jgi:hypothetical protein
LKPKEYDVLLAASLMSDLRAIGWGGEPPSYKKPKQDDGARY